MAGERVDTRGPKVAVPSWVADIKADNKSWVDEIKAPVPSWVADATKDDGLDQPWKARYGVNDDPKFDEGEDVFLLYKDGIKACRAEGSLAA